jgi:radical SAM protein with 4Fe4S-binding SPASM domain
MGKKNDIDLKGKTPQEIIKLFKENELPENFCIIPFVNLIFNPGGKISVCRQKGTEHIIGNLEDNTIEEIWNNEYIQTWREEFLTGDVKICKRETTEDFCHLGALNYNYFSEVSLTKTQTLPMKKFTANFNGKCNLECVMCDVWKMPNDYYNKNEFWDKANTEFFPYIKEMELLSGEPFVQKDTWRLIDEVAEINPDCEWSFTTNGHWKLNKFIENKLDKIKIKNLHISIDSLIPAKYSEIRLKGDLRIVLENLDLLKCYQSRRNVSGKTSLGLTLHALVMKDNWRELESFIDFTEHHDLMLILDNLRLPHSLSILSLEEYERIEILEYYFLNLNTEKLKRGMRIIIPIIKSLSNTAQKKYWLSLKHGINEND